MIKTEAYANSKLFLSLTRKNGYKAGTLYSMKPTDGAGDFVWTRSSAANRIDQAGATESMAINVPRVDYSNTCPDLLITDGGSWKDIAYNTTINWSSLKGTIFIRARIYESASAKVDTLFSINDNDSLENYLTCSTSMTRDIYIETLGGASNVNNYDYPLDTDGIYSIAIGYDFSGANNLLNIAINGELKLPSVTQTNGGPEILERLDLGSLKGTLTQVDNRIIGLMYFEDMLIDDDIVNITA